MTIYEYRSQWPFLRPNYLAKYKSRYVEIISWPWNEPLGDLINIRKPSDPTSLQTVCVEDLTQIKVTCKCGKSFEPYIYTTKKLQCLHCGENYHINDLNELTIEKI